MAQNRPGRQRLESGVRMPSRAMTAIGATLPLACVSAKDRNPPGEAIRGPSRLSGALDPSQRLKPTRSGRSCQPPISGADAPMAADRGIDPFEPPETRSASRD